MTYTSLSNSKIWEIMGDYYSHLGPDAWKDDIVPSDISSNKYIASIYAELILGKLLDWQKEVVKIENRSIYIFEIGAGHGKFGFYILKLLKTFTQNSDSELFKSIKYVMTDISKKNVESWQNHPALQEFIELGVLDFALFDAANDNKIELILSKEVIKKSTLNTPIIAICNYLIDTLHHDSFKIKNHKLYENLIKIEQKTKSKTKKDNDFFENLKFKFKLKETTNKHYKCKHLNKILQDYEQYFKKGSVLIPTGGINCIKNLEQFTNKHLIMLIADKGFSDIEEMEDLDDPDISLHGSVSLMVNFDAIKRFFESKGGISLLMPNKWSDFQISCFINKSVAAPKLTQAFYKNLSDFSPQDLFNLCYTDDDELNPGLNSINSIISLLQLSKWDPSIFSSVIYKLLELLEDDSYKEILLQHDRILSAGAKKVWHYFYDLGNNKDLCFLIGLLHYALCNYEKAIEFFKLSLDKFEVCAETYYNLALAYYELDKFKYVREFCLKALEINPKYKDAKQLLKSVKL